MAMFLLAARCSCCTGRVDIWFHVAIRGAIENIYNFRLSTFCYRNKNNLVVYLRAIWHYYSLPKKEDNTDDNRYNRSQIID